MRSPKEIVDTMMKKDAFSNWLGIRILHIDKGTCVLEATVNRNMLNGFDIGHGGISYALSDSALAFSANTNGYKCVSIESSISHIRPIQIDDILTVKSEEIHRGRTIAIYSVEIINQKSKLISKFKGTVNISSEKW